MMKKFVVQMVGVFGLVLSTGLAGEKPNILFAFADDWGRYASAYRATEGAGTPNDLVETPNFDRVAAEGVLFTNAHVTSPSCTPCRSSLLSGQYFFRTGLGAILQGAEWDGAIPSYPLILRDEGGYHIGQTYKVWSPGTPVDAPYGGTDHAYESAGSRFNGFSQYVSSAVEGGKAAEDAKQELYDEVLANFESFLADGEEGQPWCYWFGPTNVHRKWTRGSGKALWGLDPEDLKGKLPSFMPDVPVVREDFADYLGEAMAFDTALGLLLAKLEERGELENTIVVVSGDHGPPGFPRGKTNLYDFGTRVPLAAMWGDKIMGGRVVEDFVNMMDMAPTFVEAGGVEVPELMTGRSLLGILKSDEEGWVDSERDFVVTGRERHVGMAREGNLPYPQRAIRTEDYLYIRNFKPDRWPAGNPYNISETETPSEDALTNDTFVTYGDFDASPSKAWLVMQRDNAEARGRYYYDLAFAKRPEEELYVIGDDPDTAINVAEDAAYAEIKEELSKRLMAELEAAEDPRVLGDGSTFDKPPYTKAPPPKKAKGGKGGKAEGKKG
jgi:N-sulfoglucosamine sulfohydrolase